MSRRRSTKPDPDPPLEEPAGEPVEAPAATAEPPVDRGLECPRCGCRHFYTCYTRPTILKRIMRRKECRHCGWRVTTFERALSEPA